MLSPTLQGLSNQLYYLLLLISIKYSHVHYFYSFLSITNSYFISFQANILKKTVLIKMPLVMLLLSFLTKQANLEN